MSERSASQQTPMKAFAVLGPWRGGTSVVTTVLNRLGMYTGEDFVDAATEYPTFEDRHLREVCMACFDERPEGWCLNGTAEARIHLLRTWILQAHSCAVADGYVACGGKHPIMCKLVPEIAQAWTIDGLLNPLFVSVVRSQQDVHRSCTRPERTGQGLWWPRPDREHVVADLIQSRDAELANRTHVCVESSALRREPETTFLSWQESAVCRSPASRRRQTLSTDREDRDEL